MSGDVLAYTRDGAMLCDVCGEKYEGDEETGEVCKWESDNLAGSTCDDCRACYVEGWGWLPHEEAIDRKVVRWARCRACNAQTPYLKDSWRYRRDRRDAFPRGMRCDNCGKVAVRF